MHKCHNYHVILHKLYMWFGKNELRLYLNRAKNVSMGGRPPRPPPSKYAHGCSHLASACELGSRTDAVESVVETCTEHRREFLPRTKITQQRSQHEIHKRLTAISRNTL